MGYNIIIRENSSGDTVEYDMELEWSEGSKFWLTRHEGNYRCDCNRKMTWLRAHGASEEESETLCEEKQDEITGFWHDVFPCGHEAYDILYAVVDGERIPIDTPAPLNPNDTINQKGK